MRKHQIKRLQLSRETLRHLQSPALKRVGGRGDTYEIATGCDCTDGCETSTIGCATIGCVTPACSACC